MSKNSESNLILKINVSHALIGMLLLIHVGAMILVAVASLTWLPRLGVWMLLAWSLYRSVRIHALRRGQDTIEEIEIDKEGEISVRFAGSATWSSCQLRASFVHPWIMLLALRVADRKWPVNVVVAADAVGSEVFRRWRVALKLQAVAG